MGAAHAQVADRIQRSIDPAQTRALANHHPMWAVAANDAGAVPANLPIQGITLVLARSSQQEQAFDQFAARSARPRVAGVSPLAHINRNWRAFWIVRERHCHAHRLAAISGTAGKLGRAEPHIHRLHGDCGQREPGFQTELHYYTVNGKQRMSVSSDPMIPAGTCAAISSIRGLFSIDDQPSHFATTVQSRFA
ncbi:MAG: hypothetical protein WDM87_04120 [Terracidiphilus sp.]